MSDYRIERESFPLSGTRHRQVIIRLKTDEGQYRQYSYIRSEHDKEDEIADLEAEIERFLAASILHK